MTTYWSGSTDVLGGPSSRHGSLNSLFQVALYLPSPAGYTIDIRVQKQEGDTEETDGALGAIGSLSATGSVGAVGSLGAIGASGAGWAVEVDEQADFLQVLSRSLSPDRKSVV